MKIDKLCIITTLALGLWASSNSRATAQDQRPGGRRGPSVEQRMDRLNEELKLTDEQKPKVKAVLEATQKKRQELFTDSSTPPEERREKARALMNEETKKMKAILTPDQFAKYEKLREQMRGKAGKRRPAGGEEEKKKD